MIGILFDETVENRQEKGSSLPRASLCTRHHIPACHDNGNAILLNRSRLLVPGLGHVLHEDWAKSCSSEALDGARLVVTSYGDRDGVVLVEVDAAGDAGRIELAGVAVSLGDVHLLGLALLVGVGVRLLLVRAVSTHVTFFSTLATFHRLRTFVHLVTFLLTPSAHLGLRAVCGGVALLATVVTPVRLRAVVLHMALFPTHPADFWLRTVGAVMV